MPRPFIYLAAVTALVSDTIAQTITTPIWFEGYYVNGQISMYLCVNLWSTPNRTKYYEPRFNCLASAVNCAATQTFISSGRYAACFDTTEAATTACVPATECFGNTLLYPGGATVDWYIPKIYDMNYRLIASLRTTATNSKHQVYHILVVLWQYSQLLEARLFLTSNAIPLHGQHIQ